jgi:hypothetical protein
MPELAATLVAEFEEPAVALAHDAERYRVQQRRPEKNRLNARQVDSDGFALRLEAACSAMQERCQAGLLPERIEIARLAAVRRRVRRQRIPLPFKLSGTYDSRAC